MEDHEMKKGLQSQLRLVLAAVLIAVGFIPSAAAPLTQRSSRRRTKPAPSVYAQGYQKGYGEGFVQGGKDWRNNLPRDYRNSEAYQTRDAALASSSEEHRQGYELGFEFGYMDGYYGRSRNAGVPANGKLLAKAAALARAQRGRQSTVEPPMTRPRETTPTRRSQSVSVPDGTELRIQLTSPINTKSNRVGDTFTAVVITPAAYEGATVEGHISTLNRSGRVTGKTELSFVFDRIKLADGRSGPFTADLERIIESENVKRVDEEGNVQSGSKSRDSQVRGGVGAAAGAIIGGIAGGGKGAILGAIIGGAAGVGTVYIEGNKDLILDPGTEMVIRSVGRSR
jgi:hypothetical protein